MSYDGEGARPRLEFGPPPANFDRRPAPTGEGDPRALSTGGLRHWLSQSQYDLTGPERVHTNRAVLQVTGKDGLQNAALFDVTFNPRHERVVIHGILVHRDGTVRDAGVPEAFEVIQRELNLERAVYDGRKTAHMVIPDVREGDVIETLYSVIGANPVLQDRFSWWFILQWASPVAETRCTIRLSPDRPLTLRARGKKVTPSDTVQDGVRVLDWRAIDLEPYTPDAGSPLAYVGYAAVHAAETLSWAEVAEVFRPLYRIEDPLPADLAEAVAALGAAHADPEARAVEGLKLVQTALRYHSVSVGEGGFRPRTADDIWRTRYGDCKDGSVLLAMVLRALGVDAVCALVNTRIGEDLAGTPPHVLAFDHCIVRARVNGRTLWLDATSPPQAGDLDHLTQASFHWALPLEAGAVLAPMAPPPLLTVCETHEAWTFARRRTAPAELGLTTIYRGWRADGMRRWFANEGADKTSRNLREGLERELDSPLHATAPVEIRDDPAANVLTVIERYDVSQPYQTRGDGLVFVSRDEVIGGQLPDVARDRRREPLQLGLARRIVTTRTFTFPTKIQITPWREQVRGPAGLAVDSAFAWTSATQGRHSLSLTVGEPMLQPGQTSDYHAFVATARSLNGISFAVPFRNDRMRPAERKAGWLTWAFWIAVLGGLAVFRLLTA